MDHLSVDEIIGFVTAEELTEQSVKLIDRVNSHICVCSKCLETVQAFQLIYDEFLEMSVNGDFKLFLSQALKDTIDLESVIPQFKDKLNRN